MSHVTIPHREFTDQVAERLWLEGKDVTMEAIMERWQEVKDRCEVLEIEAHLEAA